jgi:tRNA nucleotidyltransferase/poly(A) polymerase
VDKGALALIRAFRKNGFETYAVGGCVRDLLLGKVPHDWDLATAADPQEISDVAARQGWKIFDGGGKRFGVLQILVEEKKYEVASFRREVYGKDSHRPDHVWFTRSLEEDLARRDFTVNAMALDERGVVYDYFGGQDDLDRRRLRTVGDPVLRFQEDALRLFRACRFAGQLDFIPDKKLLEAMPLAFYRVSGLALERIKKEINRLLLAEYPAKGLDILVRSGLSDQWCRKSKGGRTEEIMILPELSHLPNTPQMKMYHRFNAWYHTLAVVNASPPDLTVRWAALLHDAAKGLPGIRRVEGTVLTDYGHDRAGAVSAEALMKRWDMTSPLICHVPWLVANHMKFHYFVNHQEADPERWIRRIAMSRIFQTQMELKRAFWELTELCTADVIGCGQENSSTSAHIELGRCLRDIACSVPVRVQELSLDRRVPKILGDYVSEGMKNLLHRVQMGELPNESEALYRAALHYVRRRQES